MQPLLTSLQQLHNKYLAQMAQLDTTEQPVVNSYRLFHGRGRTFPGLDFVCMDYYQPVLLLTCYQEPPEGWVNHFLQHAIPLLLPAVQVVMLQRRYEPKSPSEVIWGALPEATFARRGSLQFFLQLGQQQNSGFFLDMEPGRQWIERNVVGKRVLNLFAYTCAFSVVAVAAGADKVVNIDMSSRALQIGRNNHTLNRLDKQRSEFLAENILKSWGRIKKRGPYDVVILDPPSYQPGSFVAQKDYPRLIRRLPELMPEGGLVLACLNAPELGVEFLQQIFSEQCPAATFVERLSPSEHFPDTNPEQQLKLLVFSVSRSNTDEQIGH